MLNEKELKEANFWQSEMSDLKSKMQEMSNKLKAVLEEAGVSIDSDLNGHV